jgi:hypothetical protein
MPLNTDDHRGRQEIRSEFRGVLAVPVNAAKALR